MSRPLGRADGGGRGGGGQVNDGGGPLIDVHAHFLHEGCGRSDWLEVNSARLSAGERMGVSCHVASILGSWGFTSPTYMPSANDVTTGNERMLEIQANEPDRVRSYAMVNPNYTEHAIGEIKRAVARGAVGVKLTASRRANDVMLDPVIRAASLHRLPVLHHIWQHRQRDYPGQVASDALELSQLADRHRDVNFILAHIGGGGDYLHTFAAVRSVDNIFLDISGSGVDRGMLDGALEAVGAKRILWGSDLTMETGLAKLRALIHTGASSDDLADIRWRNAARIFPPGAFPMITQVAEMSVGGKADDKS